MSELHRRWLELIDTDGPFLSVPAVKRVWPQGMPALNADLRAVLTEERARFEQIWESWDDDRRRGPDGGARHRRTTAAAYEAARDAWVDVVLRRLAGWQDNLTRDVTGLPVPLTVSSPDRAVDVAATGALAHEGQIGCLVLVVPPVDSLHDVLDDDWATSPVDRLELLLRASGVAVGVVTDGRWWGLVCARAGALAASGVVDALTWVEDRDASAAFFTLISRRHLVGGQVEDRLPALFAESVAAAEEITEALGVQVRLAVELLVTALAEADAVTRERAGASALPADTGQVYDAAVAVMMRTVFLLYAEERALLPQGQLFALGYGMAGELDVLERRERDEGRESLDSTHLTWHRLLATSQALFTGATFEDLRVPSYGGSLFDPKRFDFLLTPTERGTLALAVSDLVMLEVLRAVQVAQLKGQPARRISFRDIDVEQIGYIYEGLLGYTAARVDEVVVGLIGSRGAEPEIALRDLEAYAEAAGMIASGSVDAPAAARFADGVLAEVKESQPAAGPPSKAALVKAVRTPVDDAERALLAITHDTDLRRRLLPFVGVIRRDLRGRPLVIQTGGLVVEETPSRATAGAHYTPRALAEEVVRYALEPLVYSPGPLDGPDGWRLISSDAILDLKVADIACGSGAFLVAAARYLAGKLIEAWRHEGVAFGEPHQLQTDALRKVVANCLYGADINAMAVEMCKLSLWLVSLDPKLPFSFVDDKILHGNSLLGLTDARQLKTLHIDPERAAQQASLFDLDVDDTLDQAVRLRRRLMGEVNDADPQRSARTKSRLLADYQALTARLAAVADGVVAAGLALGGKPGRALKEAYENLALAVGAAYPADGDANPEMLNGILKFGLTPQVETDYARWKPLHWILAVPDVVERGGFDAIVGNPPFLGGKKISPALGSNVRLWLSHVLAGTSGNGDLVAYFLLRAHALITDRGTLGLIATNTLGQGDTREVGLDRVVESGFTLTRAIQSRSWPSASANLEFAAVWGSNRRPSELAVLVADDVVVSRISTLLEGSGRAERHPVRLSENQAIAFQGCIVLGKGFVVGPEVATAWIDADARNAEVLFPYLNGEDLNSRPDGGASRWVIDFGERTEPEARAYRRPWEHVLATVAPIRRLKDPVKYPRMVEEWWKFWNARPALRRAIADLDEVLVITRVSKTVMPMRVPTGQVFSDSLVVFATGRYEEQAVLSSTAHQVWAITYGSGMRNDPRYTPSDVFETFPRPAPTALLDQVGRTLDTERREIMLGRDLGLTKLYNLINDPDISYDEDVTQMRQLHVELDRAVMSAYGWDDVSLDHGFYSYRQMRRWTVSPMARVEILDRLLAENHRRAALQDAPPPATEDDADERVADEIE